MEAAIAGSTWFNFPRLSALNRAPDAASILARYKREIADLCSNLVTDNDPKTRPASLDGCQLKVEGQLQLYVSQSLTEMEKQNEVRKRVSLILLTLVIVLPFFVATIRAGQRAPEASKALWLTVNCTFVLFLVLIVVSIAVWQHQDYVIAYVPVPILEWGFAGGMAAVIHRLGYRKHKLVSDLLPWIVARPVVGFFMGGVVYFIAMVGGVLVGKSITAQTQLALNAVVFIAAFNERFANALFGRLIAFVGDRKAKDAEPE